MNQVSFDSPHPLKMCMSVVCLNNVSISWQNCTYIQNSGFPAGSTSTSALTYTVSKVSSGERHTLYVVQSSFQYTLTYHFHDCRCLHSLPGLWDLQPRRHKWQWQWQWRGLHWHLCSDGNYSQWSKMFLNNFFIIFCWKKLILFREMS